MKKTVTIKIEVDLESQASKEWVNVNEYFDNEVDDVLGKLSAIQKRRFSKYISEEGQTGSGTEFSIVVKKTKKQKK